MGLPVKGEITGNSPGMRACGCCRNGTKFDLGILSTVEDSRAVHGLLHFSALVCVQLRIEHLELAGVDRELDRARLLVYGSGGERSSHLVLVAGKGKHSSLIDVNGDFGECRVDGAGLG